MRFVKSQDDHGALERAQRDRLERDASPDRRWEYFVLRVGPKARADQELNELGSKGWQLVQIIEVEGHLAFYFEREIVDPDASE